MTVGEAHRRHPDARWAARGMIATLAFMLLLSWPIPPAQATPPEVEATVEFVIGSEVPHSYDPDLPWGVGYPQGLVTVDLGAFDPVSPDGTWSVEQVYAGMEPSDIASGTVGALGVDLTLRVPVGLTDYDDDYGGGSLKTTNWTVEAESGAGETTTVIVDAPITIVQEDGTNARFDGPATGVTITTKGVWRTANCRCFLGGHTMWSNRRGARITFTATVSEGQIIAVVMPMAENRGEARIRLDGVNQGRIDTYTEDGRENRIIMWQTPPLEAGEHSVDVINLESAGHRRIDVDAFMIAGG